MAREQPVDYSVTSIKQWIQNPWVRMAALSIYYVAILIALGLMYGRGDFSTPSFVYQGF